MTTTASKAPIAPDERRGFGERLHQEVMCAPPAAADSPLAVSTLDFAMAEVWSRPGLDRRSRRWIALTCVGAADAEAPIHAECYAALKSGDISFSELQEFVLHFAVYLGWPKASLMEAATRAAYARVHAEAGHQGAPELPPQPRLPGPIDPEERFQRGRSWFHYTVTSPVNPDSVYTHYGIANFVFGEMWCRPGLDMRARRLITVAAVGAADTVVPINSHVFAALNSGDFTYEEMQELVLQFAIYLGWPKASILDKVVRESWARIEAAGGPVSIPQPTHYP
jgi:4-carboxymuconolactone decarboxylase